MKMDSFETKYKIADIVYFISANGDIRKGKIIGIKSFWDEDSFNECEQIQDTPIISYQLQLINLSHMGLALDRRDVHEDILFKSKQEVLSEYSFKCEEWKERSLRLFCDVEFEDEK